LVDFPPNAFPIREALTSFFMNFFLKIFPSTESGEVRRRERRRRRQREMYKVLLGVIVEVFGVMTVFRELWS